MRIIFILVLICLVFSQNVSKKIQHHLKKNAFEIKSISIAESNFEDLKPLGELIGDSRFVELVDYSAARDGSSYDAISRIVTYLHKEKDFDVMFWPIGIFEATLMNQAIKEQQSTEMAARSLFAVWRMSKHVLPLLEYAKQSYSTERPLEFGGSHVLFHRYGKDNYQKHLEYIFSQMQSNFSNEQSQLMKELWTNPKRIKDLDNKELKELVAFSNDLISNFDKSNSKLFKKYSIEEIKRERIILESMRHFIEVEQLRADKKFDEANRYRTKFAIENFKQLIDNYYKNKKIILFESWSHEIAIVKQDSYSLGITAFSGYVGRPNQKGTQALEPVKDFSLEGLSQNIKPAYLLINISKIPDKIWTNHQIDSRLNSKLADGQNLNDRFSSILYIKQAYPNASLLKKKN